MCCLVGISMLFFVFVRFYGNFQFAAHPENCIIKGVLPYFFQSGCIRSIIPRFSTKKYKHSEVIQRPVRNAGEHFRYLLTELRQFIRPRQQLIDLFGIRNIAELRKLCKQM